MRTTNAETLIKQAFLQLIREKPIQKITIKEITEQANLSRSVFYLHYKDIYEVLEDIVEENISQLYNDVNAANFYEKSDYLLSFLSANKRTIQNFLPSRISETYAESMLNMFRGIANKMIAAYFPNYPIAELDISNCIALEMFGRFVLWILKGMPKESVKEYRTSVNNIKAILSTRITQS